MDQPGGAANAPREDLSETCVESVRYDETSLTDVNLRLDGWIRDLYVDYTGQPVQMGQPLLTFYSPDLLATQQEYLLALKTRDQMQTSLVPDARERAEQLVSSARQRLALWNLPEDEMARLAMLYERFASDRARLAATTVDDTEPATIFQATRRDGQP